MEEVNISKQFKKLREFLNKTQLEFGDMLGITQANISLIENGQDISSKTLIKLRSVFPELNFNWLISNKGEPFNDERQDVRDPLSSDYKDRNISYQETIKKLEEKISKLESGKIFLEKIISKLVEK